MQHIKTSSEELTTYCILISETIINLLLLLLFFESGLVSKPSGISQTTLFTLCSLTYFICGSRVGIVTHKPMSRPDQMLVRSFGVVFSYITLLFLLLLLLHPSIHPGWMIFPYAAMLLVTVIGHRLAWRRIMQAWRKRASVVKHVVFVGPLANAHELFHKMVTDPSTGFKVEGYFADQPEEGTAQGIPYLGQPAEVEKWVKNSPLRIDHLYSTLSSFHDESAHILKTCENNLIHFFVVPGIRNYVHHSMHFEILYGVPVLSLRREPLSEIPNRLLKRGFDLLCSTIFLLTVFPLVYLIIGTAIKLSSPGPVFFKQKRSGLNGREFMCYKFRSMRVNAESDTKQATANDPRKTRIGEFIRHTNIDELPQFINVFKGEMSMVGPRPHMLKHTEQYAALIDKYMVRHFVKPGITGWAQVTGFRGETKELWQMEGRVQADIWYIEHWTFVLDLYIMYLTVRNAIAGDKKAY